MSDLQLIKPLQKGDSKGQVKLIQEWLSLSGGHVALDNSFGPATEAAVKGFQIKQGLTANGIVDTATFEQLIKPMQAALKPIPADGRSLGELVVAYAQQHLVQHPLEIGGQNRGPWVRLYMNGHEGEAWAWCAGFVCFCLKQACGSLTVKLPIEPSFSVDSLVASSKMKGRFGSRKEAAPGSFFAVRRTSTDWVHTGIVVSVNDEICHTIEGNTNDDGSREGYEVCARIRGHKNMDFIII